MLENQIDEVSKDDRTIGMIAHFAGIITFIGPLAIWLIKKDQSQFVDDNGKVALNFQLTMLIGFLIGGILHVIFIGAMINAVLTVVNIILCLMNGMRAYNGVVPTYPYSITFIK